MIELMFPQTVSNILDYDGIKAAAKKYVEDVFVQITESFGNNLVLQSMDEEHLAKVARHVTGNPETTLEELLDYINTDNTYHEFEFVNELTTAFPEGVEYKAFEVTGWQFPNVDFPPFSEPDRSRRYDGTPTIAEDEVWDENSSNGEGVRNLMMARFRGQFNSVDGTPTWHKKSGRRASWGNEETWMTTGGFGKPSTIHINVDEARTVIEKNGLSSVENWLGTVSNKLPINLYIEINDQLRTYNSDDDVTGLAGSTEGYPMAFPYEEEEGFCTNDPDWPGPEPEPEPAKKEWRAYFNSNKSDFTLNYIAGYAYLYDSTGHAVRYKGSTAVFTLAQVYKENGEVGTVSNGVNTYEAKRFIANFGINENHVMQYWYSATSLTGTVNYLTYTIDPEPKAAYITVDKTVSDMASGTWYALYDESGNQIVGDSGKSYYLFIITSDAAGTQKELSLLIFSRTSITRRSDGYLYIASVSGAITSVYQVIYVEEDS